MGGGKGEDEARTGGALSNVSSHHSVRLELTEHYVNYTGIFKRQKVCGTYFNIVGLSCRIIPRSLTVPSTAPTSHVSHLSLKVCSAEEVRHLSPFLFQFIHREKAELS